MKKFSPFVLACFLALAACRKDSTPTPADCRPATMIINSGAITSAFNFSYNNEGRLSRVVNNQYEMVFDYDASGYVINFLAAGKLFRKSAVKTDAQRRPVSVTMTDYHANGTFNQELITCEYNSKGELVKQVSQKDKQPTVTTSTVWMNGNCTSISDNAQSTTVEYYTDQPIQQADILSINQLMMHGFVTVFNKNLAKSLTTGVSTARYTYEFDEAGRITTAVLSYGGSRETRLFQYSCD